MSSICPYELKGLRLEDCLTLFTKWAFNDGDERHYPNLIRIGEEIVKKCKGVPLAVRTLGSLLFQKTDESDWIYIQESEIWRLEQHVRHLLLCDEKLVGVPRVLEEMKNVRTVIIEDVSKESKTTYESLINLCLSNFKYLRALELSNSPLTALPNSIGTLKHLRELNLGGCSSIRELPRSFNKLPMLQSLNLGNTSLKQLPDSVQRLIELRHLVITIEATHLKEIRAGSWTSLQHLELRNCMELECLPEGMQYLKSLRTLVLSVCVKLVSLPRSLKFLTKLEDLFILMCHRINLKMEPEEEEDKDLQLSLKTLTLLGLHALRDLPRLLLQGSSSTLQQLGITGCPDLSVLPAWLLNLTSLHKLDIVDCRNLSALPEGIDRLTNLRELTIHGCLELSKRYRENGGEDWHKIAHIQKVVIS